MLRELIADGQIPPGDVDERSIVDVSAKELDGYDACHFFAGIGGWALALRLAEWPDGLPVWTGSCPCQPFSSAGPKKAEADERHLWPAFFRLIAKRRPPVVFGEQVASSLGRRWLSGVRLDMEGVGYAVGAADLCAAGLGAPHRRQRLFWVGHAVGAGLEGHGGHGVCGNESRRDRTVAGGPASEAGASGGLADTVGQRNCAARPAGLHVVEPIGAPDGLADTEQVGRGRRTPVPQQETEERTAPGGRGEIDRLVVWCRSVWADYSIAWCRNPKGGHPIPRRFEPAAFPLVAGFPGRVGMLRGAGNAIVPQVAAVFIRAAIEEIANPQPKET